MKTWLYVLRLIDRLRVESQWTPADNAIVGRHFSQLQELLAQKTLIMAGKTDGLDEKTFGLVVFTSPDLESARNLMDSDPAIKEGIMTGELFPYTIALGQFNAP